MSILLADSLAPADDAGDQPDPAGRLLARWHPSWLRYSPLSFTGLAMIVAAVGVVYQAGLGAALEHSRLAESGRDAAQRFGVIASVAVVIAVVVLASVVLSVLRSLVTFGNLVLRRDADVLHLEHGLLRKREHTFDMRRLRGGTLRQPLLVRLLGGARLDAVMTGVARRGGGLAAAAAVPRSHRGVRADRVDRERRCGVRPGARARRRPRRAGAGPVRSRCLPSSRSGWSVAAVVRDRADVGVDCAGGGDAVLRVSGRRPGRARSGIGSTTAGWSRGRAAWNAAATASPPRASSGGRCARRSSSAGPGWRRWSRPPRRG